MADTGGVDNIIYTKQMHADFLIIIVIIIICHSDSDSSTANKRVFYNIIIAYNVKIKKQKQIIEFLGSSAARTSSVLQYILYYTAVHIQGEEKCSKKKKSVVVVCIR